MRKINPIALSVIGGVFIFTIIYILFWVLFICLDSPSATQAAINTLGSYFGGLATLWAACVAAYLYNDWKEQEKIIFLKNVAYDTTNYMTQIMFVMQKFDKTRTNLEQIGILHAKIITNLKILNKQLDDKNLPLVKTNFQDCVEGFFNITVENFTELDKAKLKINQNILKLSSDFNYLSSLTDIDVLHKKLKKKTLT